MTQNMRLGATPGALTTPKAFTLTSADSDVSSDYSYRAADMMRPNGTGWRGLYLTGDSTDGNMYDWFVATAGTGTSSISSGDATSSICPVSGTSGKPWKLPPNVGNGSYTNMFQSSGVVSSDITAGANTTVANKMQGSPYYFPLSGRLYVNDEDETATGYYKGTTGYFWSRTARSTNVVYYFSFFKQASVYYDFQAHGYKGDGYAVRCVLVTS